MTRWDYLEDIITVAGIVTMAWLISCIFRLLIAIYQYWRKTK